MLKSFPLAFMDAKIWLVGETGLSRDALHIYVALALFVAARLVWRGRFAPAAGLTVVLLAALTGEWLDHRVEILSEAACDSGEHWHDVWNTMLWPVVLTLAIPLIRPFAPLHVAERDASGEDAERRFEQS